MTECITREEYEEAQEILKKIEELKPKLEVLEKRYKTREREKKKNAGYVLADTHWPGYAFHLQVGDEYYSPYLYQEGIDGTEVDSEEEARKATSFQMCSATEKEAEFAHAHRAAKAEYIKLMLEENGGNPNWIDWGNGTQGRYYPVWMYRKEEFAVVKSWICQEHPSWMYGKSEKAVRNVLDKMGEEKFKMAVCPL